MENKKRRQHVRHLLAVTFFIACWVISVNSAASRAVETLYVAGAQDNWPLEYYDDGSNMYRGVLADLLKEAAEQAEIPIEYVEEGNGDQRLRLAKNIQVDAVWTIGLTLEEVNECGLEFGKIHFYFEENGERKTAVLAYTKSMPEKERRKLESAFIRINEARTNGFLVQYANEQKKENEHVTVIRNVVLLIAVAAILALVISWRWWKRRKRKLEAIAYNDEITGGDNFTMWKDKMVHWVLPEVRAHYAVLYMHTGLDVIGHLYGYAEAEHMLNAIYEACVPLIAEEREAFARFREFEYIFFIQYTSQDDNKARVQEIHDAIEGVCKMKKKIYQLELHTGIYHMSHTDGDILRVLQYSEIAMKYAREHDIPYAFYDGSIEAQIRSGYALEQEAVQGLMHQEFVMYLHPMIDLHSGNICGAEALVRWNNPNRGMLKPEDFLKIMDQKKLTGKMNMEIYRQGCRLLKEQAQAGRKLRLLFNFTIENIEDEQFTDYLSAAADQYGIDHASVIIQLNQIIKISESKQIMHTVEKLRQHGFDVCISSLEIDNVFFQYLEYGVNAIKLRRELIRQIEKPEGKKVAKSVIALCHNLGLQIICVGVETQEQERFLRENRCDVASGFYYYHPIKEDTFVQLLNNGMI